MINEKEGAQSYRTYVHSKSDHDIQFQFEGEDGVSGAEALWAAKMLQAQAHVEMKLGRGYYCQPCTGGPIIGPFPPISNSNIHLTRSPTASTRYLSTSACIEIFLNLTVCRADKHRLWLMTSCTCNC